MIVGLIALLAALAGLFWLLSAHSALPTEIAGFDIATLVAAAVLSAYVAFLFSGVGGRFGQAFRALGIWAALALALVGGYAYRDEISVIANRVAGELAPPGHTISAETDASGERAVRIRRRGDGHFVARTEINGTIITMLVDTGASTVVLRPADAQRIGIDTKTLSYTVAVKTANGTAFAAPARLQSISIGGIQVRDVEALVAKPGTLNESLLGMSFLRRLRSYEFSGEFLTLRG